MSDVQRSPRSKPRFDDLVEISTHLFRQHGFERTTVRMIASEMGVLSGSLYSHISSKDEILVRIAMSVSTLYFERVAGIVGESCSNEEKLRKMARAHLSVLRDRPDAVSVYFDEWRKLDEEHRAEIASGRKKYEQLFVNVVAEGMANGEFAQGDPRDAARVLLAACNWSYQWNRSGKSSSDEMADSFSDVVLNGIVVRDS